MPPVDVNKIHYKELNITGASASARKDHELAVKLFQVVKFMFLKLLAISFH